MTPIDDEKSENPIDEYITFCEVMKSKFGSQNPITSSSFINLVLFIFFVFLIFILESDMELQDPQYYALLMSRLNAEQTKGLQSVLDIAKQKRAQYESQAIERQGGKHSIFGVIQSNENSKFILFSHRLHFPTTNGANHIQFRLISIHSTSLSFECRDLNDIDGENERVRVR